MSIFLKTCCPLWHRILTNNFYTPCTTLPSSPQTHFNVSFIPSCILMELYTGELLFGTHENLEHLALMDWLFCFTQGETFRLCDWNSLKTTTWPVVVSNVFFIFMIFHAYLGKIPILTSINHQAENSLKHRQEASLGNFPSKMLSQATGQPRDKCPGLEPVLKILKGKNWTQVDRKKVKLMKFQCFGVWDYFDYFKRICKAGSGTWQETDMVDGSWIGCKPSCATREWFFSL